MKILYLAYACEPGAGSEYGVGWMVPLTMAQQYPDIEVYVLTRSRCRDKIEAALSELAEGKFQGMGKVTNLQIMFYDVPTLLYYKKEMSSHWGEQYNYLMWQLCVRGRVRKAIKDHGIDILHHITFNQYRTPSPGYWMKIPFVIGPIGGAEVIAPALWQDLEEHSARKEAMRLKGRDLPLFRYFNTRSKNKKVILCSARENVRRLEPYKGDSDMALMPAIGISQNDINQTVVTASSERMGKPMTVVYAGKALDWKGLHLFLRAASRAFVKPDMKEGKPALCIKLIGIRTDEEQKKVKSWVEEEGLQDSVDLIPFMKRDELLHVMTECDLSVYPAFRDSGSMSVLEACSLGCPTICFDAGGQDAFPDDILIKVRVRETYNQCVEAFAERLRWCIEHRDELPAIGEKSRKWVSEHLTWEKKAAEFMRIYEGCIRLLRRLR